MPRSQASRVRALVASTAIFICILAALGWLYFNERENLWERARTQDTVDVYEEYLVSPFAEERHKASARTRIVQLKRQIQIAVRNRDRINAELAGIVAEVEEFLSRIERDIRAAEYRNENETAGSARELMQQTFVRKEMQFQLIEEIAIQGGYVKTLSDRLAHANELLEAEKYGEAANEFAALEKDHHLLQRALGASSDLAGNYVNAQQSRDEWEAIRTAEGIGRFQQVEELDAAYLMAEEMIKQLAFSKASSRFAELGAQFAELTQLARYSGHARKEVGVRKQSWEEVIEEHGFDPALGKSYASRFADAQALWKSGQIATSGEHFSALSAEYTAIEEQARNSISLAAKAAKARQRWMEFAVREGLDTEHTRQLDERHSEAQSLQQRGSFAQASAAFSRIETSYAEVLSGGDSMVSSLARAKSQRDQWRSVVGQGWARERTGNNADRLMEEAQAKAKIGAYTDASDQFGSAASIYTNLVERTNANRHEFEADTRAWEQQMDAIRDNISQLRRQVSQLTAEMGEHRADTNRDCDNSTFLGELATAFDVVACEMSCTRTSYAGGVAYQYTDQYCLNDCRRKDANRRAAKERRIRQCTREIEMAQRRYDQAQDNVNQASSELRLAEAQLRRKQQSQPQFAPI